MWFAQTSLVLLAASVSSASGLIITVLQQSSTGAALPKLRLCRPSPGQNPVAINPLKESCPAGSPFWLWQYNGTPSVEGATLINLLGPSGPREVPGLLNEQAYNTMFSYGYTNPGLRAQLSSFRVKDSTTGAYKRIDSNTPLKVDDLLEFYGPVAPNAQDRTLRRNTLSPLVQSQNKQPPYLMRQITNAQGQPIAHPLYPTVRLQIASLGNQEIVAQEQSWWQKGTNLLSQAGTAIQSAYNAAAPSLSSAYNSASNWVSANAPGLIDKAGAAVNNAGNYLVNKATQPLAATGQWVGDQAGKLYASGEQVLSNLGNKAAGIASPLYNAAGTYLNNAIDNITVPLANAGEWVGNQASYIVNNPRAVAKGALNAITALPGQASAKLDSLGNTIADNLVAAGDSVNNGLINAYKTYGNLKQQAKTATANRLTSLAGWFNPAIAAGQMAPVGQQGAVTPVTPVVAGGQVLETTPLLQEQVVGAAVPVNEVPVVEVPVGAGTGMDTSLTGLSASQYFSRFRVRV
ncbi:hypothetical protein ABW20_dc0102596 [Dactylellina cionopaga]|nr:hypothetical protein ABW20_dc0102596 [Dactylellina cionopaga]